MIRVVSELGIIGGILYWDEGTKVRDEIDKTTLKAQIISPNFRPARYAFNATDSGKTSISSYKVTAMSVFANQVGASQLPYAAMILFRIIQKNAVYCPNHSIYRILLNMNLSW